MNAFATLDARLPSAARSCRQVAPDYAIVQVRIRDVPFVCECMSSGFHRISSLPGLLECNDCGTRYSL